MEKTTLYLTAELQRGLRDLARRTGRPQATLIREALDRYVAGEGRPRPASIGVAADGTLDATESEAWLRATWSGMETRAPARGSRGSQGRQPRRSPNSAATGRRATGR